MFCWNTVVAMVVGVWIAGSVQSVRSMSMSRVRFGNNARLSPRQLCTRNPSTSCLLSMKLTRIPQAFKQQQSAWLAAITTTSCLHHSHHYQRRSSSGVTSRGRILMMPEGPEVRTLVDQLNVVAVGCRLIDWQFTSGRYSRSDQRPKGFYEFAATMTRYNTNNTNPGAATTTTTTPLKAIESGMGGGENRQESQLHHGMEHPERAVATFINAASVPTTVDTILDWQCKGKFMYILLDAGRPWQQQQQQQLQSQDGVAATTSDDYQRSIWITLGMTGRFMTQAAHDRLPANQQAHFRWYMVLLPYNPPNMGSTTTTTPTTTRLSPFRIYYHDARSFGTVQFSLRRSDLEQKLASLGPDILDPSMTALDFIGLVAGTKPTTNICRFLMDQSKLSGIGNYLLAEALYRACIDPFCVLSELNTDQQSRLWEAIQSTAQASYQAQGMTRKAGGQYRTMDGQPGQFTFELQCYGRSVCARGDPVLKDTRGPHGRTIWYTEAQLFVPRCARRIVSTTTTITRATNTSIPGAASTMSLSEPKPAPPRGTSNAEVDEPIEMTTNPENYSITSAHPSTPDQKPWKDISGIDIMKTLGTTKAMQMEDQRNTIQKSSNPAMRPTQRSSLDLSVYLTEPTWKSALTEPFQSDSFQRLTVFLQEERTKGAIVYPETKDLFAALNACPMPDIKVVIVGQDPYHGPGQGHGLAFSVRRNVRPPPSLVNIITEVVDDIGIEPPRHGNLKHWANQGVLLLNTVLTVRQGQAQSHAGRGWEEFTDTIIRILNQQQDARLVFLLWGNPAHVKAASVDTTRHVVIRTSHPSPLGATKTVRPFLGSRCFSRTNQILVEWGKDPIDWSLL